MKYLLFIFLLSSFSFGEPATKDDIKLLIELIKSNQEQTNKRFEQIDKRFEQIDKRFEQVDKRFEQIDKRFTFMQSLIYILMGLVFASPFIAIYLKNKEDSKMREVFDTVKNITFTLRELAQNDDKIHKALKLSNLI
jgi:tetrahydromethanopterin S-methyltransferase subunit G